MKINDTKVELTVKSFEKLHYESYDNILDTICNLFKDKYGEWLDNAPKYNHLRKIAKHINYRIFEEYNKSLIDKYVNFEEKFSEILTRLDIAFNKKDKEMYDKVVEDYKAICIDPNDSILANMKLKRILI